MNSDGDWNPQWMEISNKNIKGKFFIIESFTGGFIQENVKGTQQ